MSSRIPPLLEPYLSLPPEASLILLTSVLGASTNWLVLRFLHRTLLDSDVASGRSEDDEPRVVLVSFMRDLGFWKENARRLGLDLDKLTAKRRFAYVDGLSGLFLPKQQRDEPGRNGQKTLESPALTRVSEGILEVVEQLKGGNNGSGKVLLVIDQLDLLLAAGGEQVDAIVLGEMLMGLREQAHATVITFASDYPLVSAQHTPLEINHAAFLLNAAHQADFIMSLRLLDTGTARDVSGVVRITAGDPSTYDESSKAVEEKELLYFVGGDGGVKVFERGQ